MFNMNEALFVNMLNDVIPTGDGIGVFFFIPEGEVEVSTVRFHLTNPRGGEITITEEVAEMFRSLSKQLIDSKEDDGLSVLSGVTVGIVVLTDEVSNGSQLAATASAAFQTSGYVVDFSIGCDRLRWENTVTKNTGFIEVLRNTRPDDDNPPPELV